MSTGSNRSVLVDTNVLVYAVDADEGGKSRRAIEVLEAIAEARVGAINSQVLTEFYAVTTRARRRTTAILDGKAGALWVERWLAMFEFGPITEMMTREAVRGARDHQLNIYDAQIWAAAKLGGIDIVLSEDSQSRASIEGVRYVDPFAAAFKVAQIGL
jgi:predicted nucleic acid-binding protein